MSEKVRIEMAFADYEHQYLICDSVVRNNNTGCIGIVLVNEEVPRDCFVAYIGVCKHGSIKQDAQDIAANGTKLAYQEAKAFFPGIKAKEYKSY